MEPACAGRPRALSCMFRLFPVLYVSFHPRYGEPDWVEPFAVRVSERLGSAQLCDMASIDGRFSRSTRQTPALALISAAVCHLQYPTTQCREPGMQKDPKACQKIACIVISSTLHCLACMDPPHDPPQATRGGGRCGLCKACFSLGDL